MRDDSFCRVNGERVIMGTETKEKLTELQHQHDLLKTRVDGKMETIEAKNKAALAENESAIDRLVASNERFINTITMRMIGVVGLGVAILAVFITILQFFE